MNFKGLSIHFEPLTTIAKEIGTSKSFLILLRASKIHFFSLLKLLKRLIKSNWVVTKFKSHSNITRFWRSDLILYT
jgi:hypothetical protein